MEGSFFHLTEPVGLGAVPKEGFPPSSEMEFWQVALHE